MAWPGCLSIEEGLDNGRSKSNLSSIRWRDGANEAEFENQTLVSNSGGGGGGGGADYKNLMHFWILVGYGEETMTVFRVEPRRASGAARAGSERTLQASLTEHRRVSAPMSDVFGSFRASENERGWSDPSEPRDREREEAMTDLQSSSRDG